jgi:hypothetical protein
MCPGGTSLLLAKLHLRIRKEKERKLVSHTRIQRAVHDTLASPRATNELRLNCTDVEGLAVCVVASTIEIAATGTLQSHILLALTRMSGIDGEEELQC